MNSIDYPPLYTLQPSNRLRDMQMAKWTYILFENARKSGNNVFDPQSSVFCNKKIGRKADPKLVAYLVHYLCSKNLCRESKTGKGKYELQLLTFEKAEQEISRMVFDKGLFEELLDFEDIAEAVKTTPVGQMGLDFLADVLAYMVKKKQVVKYTIDGIDSYKFYLSK